VLVAVAAYAVVMVISPSTADRLVYAPLGFGAAAHGVDAAADGHVGFTTAVLGAVLLGWTAMLLALSRRLTANPWLWRIIVQSLTLWFAADTTMSLIVGYPTHALFNVGFALAMGVPLARLRPRSPA
jgi:hypothetical protein